ncbi:MAG TPA: nucleotide pyrophosphohydrolase [Aggregatilineaceae bacterium]|nr:nucleotide pyrophosphohydrolase [Aggregatilineaceae bacterium]
MPTPSDERLTLDDLTRLMHDFVRAKGWYEPDSIHPQTPRNLAASICIEAAEVLEHFQWDGEAQDREALAGELADVALYLLQLASVTGIDLERAILDTLDTNYGRTWAHERGSDTGTGSADDNA